MTPPGATAAARRAAASRRSARVAAPPAPRTAPRIPRRVSGPAGGRALRRGHATLGARALAGLRRLPDHVIVDRLTRGRLWIGLVACLLLGLVTMQVALLKLNAAIGRSVQQAGTLERRNGELQAAISRLGSEQRLQSIGVRLGLVMPEAGHVTYLSVRRGQDAAAAAAALRANRLGTAAAQGATQARGPAAQAQAPAASSTAGAGPTQPAAAPDQAGGQSPPTSGSDTSGAGTATDSTAPAAATDGTGPQG